MLSRREVIGKLAAGAAGVGVAWAAGVARPSAASARGNTNAPMGSQPQTGMGSEPGAEPPAAVAEAPAQEAHAAMDASPPVSAPPPWELLRPLAQGSEVAHGWRVAELSAVVDGTCVLTLQNARGRTHRVHLCGNDGRPQGLVYTDRFDMVVMNGGQGDLPTEEGLAQAVAEVAHVLAANESGHAAVVAELLPHAERLRQFATAAGSRLR